MTILFFRFASTIFFLYNLFSTYFTVKEVAIVMNIDKIIDEIMNIKKTIQNHTHSYMYDSELTNIIDEQLNAKVLILKLFLKNNNLNQYLEMINDISSPICGNAIQFVELVDAIKDDIKKCTKWSNPKERLQLINNLASTMQEKYDIASIDILFGSLGIECGKEFYTVNSKKTYVQNVLQKEPIIKIISLAQIENIFDELIDIEDTTKILSNNYIDEQIKKCAVKINNNDYDGAITNARTLLEEVLLSIEEKISGVRQVNDGDLLKLYKRVRKLLNLEPDDKAIDNSLQEITRGMVSIVNGFSGLSNNSGDRHACTYKPSKRHALLTVNSTLIICQFLIESYESQYILN